MTHCCNVFRQAFPRTPAQLGHPIYSSYLKIDQTLYRHVAAQTLFREAFLQALEPRYTPSLSTHPLDGHMALYATYVRRPI
jgi:hypothetical protein